jgi:predicted helicase
MTSKRNLLEFMEGINDFQTFTDKLSKIESTKVKGDLFEIFCEAYLVRIYPQDFTFVKRLENIDDTSLLKKLNLRISQDYGIDLIAITETGKIWTIQAKFRSNNILNWRELSTFFSSSEKADFKLVMGNLDKIYHPLTKIENYSSILNFTFRDLNNTDFDNIKQYLGARIKLEKFKPKSHQKKAIDHALKYYQKFDKGQMIHACGTGKTLTSLWIKEALKPKNTVIFVPSLSLLKQTLEEWFKHKSKKFSILCVCSDQSVIKGRDDLDEPIIDITELGVPVTTDKSEINNFINQDTDKIVFCTYQSTEVLLESTKNNKYFKFDFGIFDEAHRTTSTAGRLFSLCHAIPVTKKLFMTATPRIYEPHLKKKAEAEDVLLCSMDDPELYGHIFDEINFGEAIELKLLSDYRIKLILITGADIKNIIDERYWMDVFGKAMTTDELAKIWALIQSMSEVNHVISFHSKIKRAKDFQDNLQHAINLIKEKTGEEHNIRSYHISGKDPASVRSAILNEFIKDKKSLVTNARCLTEGVDVPNIDGVYFVDPKKNLIDIVQAVGRAIRKKTDPKITYGSIILPVFLSEDTNFEDLVESSAFEPIWKVLQAMKDQDNRLAFTIEKLRILEGLQSIKKPGSREKQELKDLEDDISNKIDIIDSTLAKKIDIVDFLSKISIQTIKIIGNNWDFNFGLLKGFMEEYGHEPSSSSKDIDEKKIGQWASSQRQAFSKGLLQRYPDRMQKMKSIDFELDLKKARMMEEWKYPKDKKPTYFWMQTGALTGGSRNILDLSMSGPNGSLGGVGLFGIDSSNKELETNLIFIYKNKEYHNNTIKFPSSQTKKPNDSWRLQIKGVADDGEKLAPLCKNNFRHKVLTFKKVAEKKFLIVAIDENQLDKLKKISISWDKSGLSKFGRLFGILK